MPHAPRHEFRFDDFGSEELSAAPRLQYLHSLQQSQAFTSLTSSVALGDAAMLGSPAGFQPAPSLSIDMGASPAIGLALTENITPITGIEYNTGKATTALLGLGGAPQPPSTVIILSPDTVANDITTDKVITVGALPTEGTINTIGDQDYYKVELTAGQSYEFGLYARVGGPSAIALADAYLEVYDAQGQLLASGDGGAQTLLNNANSGFDVLMSFTASTSGTYYLNARAFDQDPTNGTAGDFVGDYTVFARPAEPGGYQPYYDASSPLYAIDWGTQVDGTVRNPDGAESGHITGNPPSTPENPYGYNQAGKNVITIYFAKAGDVFISEDPTNPGLPPATITATGVQEFEHTAVMTALAEFSKVADVVYVEVDSRDEANFIYTSYQGTPGPGVSLLGSMSPPGESDEGLAQFNSGDYRWNATDLQQGGFSFVTLIHEFGHGHGLAHPHDNGGRSGIMNGVESDGVVADYTTGDYDLNQAVFTMMSYEDGWQTSPYGNAETDVGYGYLGGLMAFDIAAIQDKYGVNETYASGNDVYTLKDENAAGTYYSSIWDTGGTDSIVYSGSKDANIDLRPATLEYEHGGGGWVSYAYGIYGGYTIANGVVIENATGGSGNDTLTGNDAANTLDGGAGNDTMNGGAGNDSYVVDSLGDAILDASGWDSVSSSISYTLASNLEVLTLTGSAAINGTGNATDNRITGNAGDNRIDGGLGRDTLFGGAGADKFVFDTALGGSNYDAIGDFSVSQDKILLDRDIFTAISHDGALDLSAFRQGSAALDLDDRIIYDSSTGNIYYDADGIGAGQAKLFAQVAVGTVLTAGHFEAFI